MKILVIEGSPHRKGSSNLLANQFMKGAKEVGHEVTIFDAAHANISPCLGCDTCGMSRECCLKDDMKQIRDLVLSTDMVVFVTPLYYFGMSAQLKVVIDRFYSFNNQLSGLGLKTALIVAAWDHEDKIMLSLKNHYQIICEYLGFQNQGLILGMGCGTVSMTERSGFMNEAYKLGKSV